MLSSSHVAACRMRAQISSEGQVISSGGRATTGCGMSAGSSIVTSVNWPQTGVSVTPTDHLINAILMYYTTHLHKFILYVVKLYSTANILYYYNHIFVLFVQIILNVILDLVNMFIEMKWSLKHPSNVPVCDYNCLISVVAWLWVSYQLSLNIYVYNVP